MRVPAAVQQPRGTSGGGGTLSGTGAVVSGGCDGICGRWNSCRYAGWWRHVISRRNRFRRCDGTCGRWNSRRLRRGRLRWKNLQHFGTGLTLPQACTAICASQTTSGCPATDCQTGCVNEADATHNHAGGPVDTQALICSFPPNRPQSFGDRICPGFGQHEACHGLHRRRLHGVRPDGNVYGGWGQMIPQYFDLRWVCQLCKQRAASGSFGSYWNMIKAKWTAGDWGDDPIWSQ